MQSAEASYTVVEKGGTESKTNNGIEFNASWDNPIYSDDNVKPTVDALFGLNLIKDTVVEKGGTESKTNNGIEFNASWDNPIYSDDNVKPTVDALFGLNLIKAF